MSESKSKGKMTLIIAVLAIAIVSQINTIASVMLADISLALNVTDPTALQYVMQFGMIGGFPIALAMTILARHFRRKPMILIGLVFILVGGALPIFFHSSLVVLYVCAFLVGFGQGFLSPLLGTTILTSFEGTMQNRMLGLNTTFGTGGAAVLLVLAGWLCKTGWVNVYYLYFMAIPVFVIALLFLPMDPKPQDVIAADAASGGSKAAIPAVGVINCCLSVVLMVAYAVFPLNINLFVVAEGIGTSAETGLSMSLVTIVGALVGLVLPQIIKMFKLYISTVGAIAGLLATIVAMVSKNITMVYVASVLDGVFFGIVMAGGGYIINRICKPSQIAPTFSLSMAMVTLGTIFSPIIVNFVTSLMFGEVTPKGSFTVGAIIFGVGVVLCAVWATYLTKKFPEKAPAGAAQG